MSRVSYVGLGEELDGEKVKVNPPGNIIALSGDP